jgi:hypothetical protein
MEKKFKHVATVSRTTKVEIYYALHRAGQNCSQEELELLFELTNDPDVQAYLNLFLASLGLGDDRHDAG